MRSALFATLLTLPCISLAVPVTYDFTGSGTLCTYTGTGTSWACESQSYAGFVTIDVLASGPSGVDSVTDGSTYAYDSNGWVQSDFTIQWDSTSFNPGPLPGQTYSDSRATVSDNGSSGYGDILSTREHYSAFSSGYYAESNAELVRWTTDLSWLNGLAFDQSVGLSPGANEISFRNTTSVYNSATDQNDWTGFVGEITLTSLTARTATSVPEPGTFALLGLGLVGVGLSRRRAKAKAKRAA